LRSEKVSDRKGAKMSVGNDELIARAKAVSGRFPLRGFAGNSAGEVAAALVTADGNVYTGICIDVACSLGFCAEHAAIAEMLKHRETRVRKIVAVRQDGRILPPCGRCREMLVQIDPENVQAEVIVDDGETVPLADLLPRRWSEVE
jgi:cytidine deaminase